MAEPVLKQEAGADWSSRTAATLAGKAPCRRPAPAQLSLSEDSEVETPRSLLRDSLAWTGGRELAGVHWRARAGGRALVGEGWRARFVSLFH